MTVRATALRTNSRVEPLGIGTAHPEFSWHIEADVDDVLQTKYRIEVSTDESFDAPVWSTSASSDLPFGVRYEGHALASTTRYAWRVRVSTTQGESEWSDPSWFETGMLEAERWSARWLAGPATPKKDDPVLYLRGGVHLGADVVRARAYVSALGWYRLFINGSDITGDALVPRFTPLSEVVEYQVYDVTDAVRSGENSLAIAVGDGRYRGGLGLTGNREAYGKRIAALAQVEIELADGSTVTSVTDDTWFAGRGRITGSDPKNGERADLRIPDADWLTGPLPARFAPVDVLSIELPLIAEDVERVERVDTLAAAVSRAPSGAQLLDFGQNFSGVIRIKMPANPGAVVQMTFTELLTPDGEIDVKSFTDGFDFFQRDVVTLGHDEQWYQPWFTTHGFRYVEVIGLEHDIDTADVQGVVISSALKHTGSFDSSDPRLNQLYGNVLWSVISNFTDTPTDCPTRERAGWTGDIQAFAPTAAVMVDTQAYLDRYLSNVLLEQWDDGFVPIYVPSQMPVAPSLGRRITHYMSGAVGWSDAAVLLPWTQYRYYGDRAVLSRQYESMRKRVDGMRKLAASKPGGRFILNSGFHFGEWLRPGENPLKTIAGHLLRSPAEIATAYFAHATAVLSNAAAVLGRDEDAHTYAELAENIKAAWRAKYVHTDGTLALDRQDDYARALAFELLLPEQRAAAVSRLVTRIADAGGHLTTGFLSTPMILKVLVDGGRQDAALALLFQNTVPSWLYPVERGATTIWESWDGYKPDGHGKQSHNHYALGAVAGWLTEGLAGLTPASAAYRTLRIAPVVAPQLDHARASIITPFGAASSGWRREGGDVILEVTVPAGTNAEVAAPWSQSLGSGTHLLRAKAE